MDRRGPPNWQERNERAFWGADERDAPNYDESLLPDDEYESEYCFESEGSGPEDWGSEWGDWADRASLAFGRRGDDDGRRHMTWSEHGGQRAYGVPRSYGNPGRHAEQGGYRGETPALRRHHRMDRHVGYDDTRYGGGQYGGAARWFDDARIDGGAPGLPHFGGPGTERRAPRRRQGPKGYTRSDERIREDVCERLADALDIDVSDVSVQVQDGRVELEGSVPVRWMKHGIEDIADSCMGVRDVDNRVKVHRDEIDTPAPAQVLRPDQRTVTATPHPVRQEPDGGASGRKPRR
ncbi:BON domain-containing protein [Burkholderia sp. PU8-34]